MMLNQVPKKVSRNRICSFYFKNNLYTFNKSTDDDVEICDPCLVEEGTDETISQVRLTICYSLSSEYSISGCVL
jgi:hypothetical protein